MPLSVPQQPKPFAKVAGFTRSLIAKTSPFLGLTVLFGIFALFNGFSRLMAIVCLAAYIVERWDLLEMAKIKYNIGKKIAAQLEEKNNGDAND